MNYYQHHIGDFNNATRHLTRVERSLYRDLIELYYDTEQPLIGDVPSLARKVIAREEGEIEALECVLHEFFELIEGCYHNIRCDADLKKYRDNSKAKSRAGKASAAKRKQKATRVEQTKNGCVTNQEPVTSNQIKDIVEYLNEKAGKKFKPVESNAKFIRARLDEGHKQEDIFAVIDRKVAQWLDDPEMNQYLRPATLFNAEKFNQYVGELGSPLPQKKAAKPDWAKIPADDNALEKFAKQHGHPNPGRHDTYQQYRQSLHTAIRQRAAQEGFEL